MQQKVSRWIVSLMAVVALAVSVPALAAPKARDVKAVATGTVDLNTATQAELEKLPGVGAATAKKIMAGRPYASTSELSTKAKLPAKTVEKISPLVTVGGGAKAAKPAMPAAPKPTMTVPAAKTPAMPKAAAPAKVAVPPVGRGMVWVNPDSKVYHKEGSRWYGKTKKGSYMTESEAIKAGYRAPKQGGKEQ
ncbi:ComEA family DNA-binding protein [Geobacter grbiciae]|uniref:ComEA family DNA-binding protein n=1 Tax=Geobacter grbiciae TaxID=155042 RepID=UPI001C020FA3|nr:helix-hairpin-helix domain-containing protein [Geobacter grbiciae]MBT1076900.1 helix-hairpin-helix domain-containing protein [Geobacter grbiciae]